MRPHANVPRRGIRPEAPRRKVLTAVLPAAFLCAGCALPPPATGLYQRLQDENPAVRAEAAADAAKARDAKALPFLVDRLGDPEPDVRLMASAALRQMTGTTYETMGWRFYDPPSLRAEALDRWRQWLRGGGKQPQTSQAP
jgi:hypothetical protein